MTIGNRAETYIEYFEVFYAMADDRCRAYWGTDRPNGQAAGLESLVHFGGKALTLIDPDALVIDAGAGASSAIIRTYFKNVLTCDPDAEYLAQVKAACESMGLGHGQWVSGVPDVECAACFYDYGTRERIPTLAHFLDQTKRFFWLDDAHDTELLAAAERIAEERGRLVFHAREAIDEHGRFGAYVIKPV